MKRDEREVRSESDAVSFDVNYQLDEHLSVVSEFILVRINRRLRKKSPNAPLKTKIPWHQRPLIALVARLMFRYKVHKVDTCSFEIDENGVKRTCKMGELYCPWDDVIAVHRFSQAYLVEKNKGAMPLPYRCLNDSQIAQIDSIIDAQVK